MTLDEFIERLKAVAPEYHWTLVNGERIRGRWLKSYDVGCCPITAVDPSRRSAMNARDVAAHRLHLNSVDADAIMEAADEICVGKKAAAALRRRLLEAVGLAP